MMRGGVPVALSRLLRDNRDIRMPEGHIHAHMKFRHWPAGARPPPTTRRRPRYAHRDYLCFPPGLEPYVLARLALANALDMNQDISAPNTYPYHLASQDFHANIANKTTNNQDTKAPLLPDFTEGSIGVSAADSLDEAADAIRPLVPQVFPANLEHKHATKYSQKLSAKPQAGYTTTAATDLRADLDLVNKQLHPSHAPLAIEDKEPDSFQPPWPAAFHTEIAAALHDTAMQYKHELLDHKNFVRDVIDRVPDHIYGEGFLASDHDMTFFSRHALLYLRNCLVETLPG